MRVIGILNVTPDSFSDGGRYLALRDAVAHGLRLRDDGADIIDVGGESTRPGAAPVPLDEELRRVAPVVRRLAEAGVRVSIDTTRARVAEAAIEAGAEIVNDVSGGTADAAMRGLVAATGVEVIAMHSAGASGRTLQYTDVVADVRDELRRRVGGFRDAGVPAERILLDPGIGFSKAPADNWALLARLDELGFDGHRIVVGASRKRFLAALLPHPTESHLDAATAATTTLLARDGIAWGVRVHDVVGARAAIEVVRATASSCARSTSRG